MSKEYRYHYCYSVQTDKGYKIGHGLTTRLEKIISDNFNECVENIRQSVFDLNGFDKGASFVITSLTHLP